MIQQLYQPVINDNQFSEEEHSNLFGCAFQGLGKAGRKKCREDNAKAKTAQATADAALTQAAADSLSEPDDLAGSTDDDSGSATPFIIGGIVLAVVAIVTVVAIKMRKK